MRLRYARPRSCVQRRRIRPVNTEIRNIGLAEGKEELGEDGKRILAAAITYALTYVDRESDATRQLFAMLDGIPRLA